MQMDTRDILTKKLLDAQEMVRDYEMYSKKVEDQEIAQRFKEFAEECGMQARELQMMVDRYKKQ